MCRDCSFHCAASRWKRSRTGAGGEEIIMLSLPCVQVVYWRLTSDLYHLPNQFDKAICEMLQSAVSDEYSDRHRSLCNIRDNQTYACSEPVCQHVRHSALSGEPPINWPRHRCFRFGP